MELTYCDRHLKNIWEFDYKVKILFTFSMFPKMIIDQDILL